MLSKTLRTALGALAIAACSTLGMNTVHAQTAMSSEPSTDLTSRFYSVPENSSRLVWGVGGGMNANMGYGDYHPAGSTATGTRNGTDFQPEAHLLLEVPVANNLAFSPRISYNNLSTKLNRQSGSTMSSGDVSVAYQTLGLDALLKYNIAGSGAYIMGGAGVAEAVKRSYQVGTSNTDQAAFSNQQMPNVPYIIPSATAGLGFDIPVRTNEMWISPEVTYSVPLMNLAQGSGDGSLGIQTVTTKVSAKFAIH